MPIKVRCMAFSVQLQYVWSYIFIFIILLKWLDKRVEFKNGQSCVIETITAHILKKLLQAMAFNKKCGFKKFFISQMCT